MPLDNPVPPRIVDVWRNRMARVPNTPIYTGARRRSQRVLMQVGVRVSGADALGNNFEEYTETLAISAHGALILLANSVTRNANDVLLHNMHTAAHDRPVT